MRSTPLLNLLLGLALAASAAEPGGPGAEPGGPDGEPSRQPETRPEAATELRRETGDSDPERLQSAPRVRGADEALFEKGYVLALTGKFEEARAVFEALAEAHPESRFLAEALFWTGYCRVEAGEYGEAAAAYERLAAEHPASEFADDALLKLGEVYQVHLKDYGKAIAAYARLGKQEENPLAPVALNRNGDILQRRFDRLDEARVNYERAAELADAQQEKQAARSVPNTQALRARRQIFQFDNNDPEALRLYNRGQNEQEAGNWGPANDLNAMILRQYPNSPLVPEAMLGIAECLTKQGELEKAREKYAEILRRYAESEAAKGAESARAAVERALEIRASRAAVASER